MKQTKTLRRISVAIVAVLLITMSVLSVTLAKYTQSDSFDGKINAAKWDVTVTKAESVTNYNEVTEGMVAPGTTGTITLTITNASNVDINYTLTFGMTSNKDVNEDGTNDLPQGFTFTADKTSGTIEYDAETKTQTIVLTWAWAYDDATESGSYDANHMKYSNNAEFSWNVEVVTTQAKPTPKTGA